ncbi:hypothetical protein [Streptomyces abyssomicinicus]|uniref:hypothetical protein n=1 Tax=Streptomyces abyssomicinicus TaxID=574929 RepID=UPI00350E475F
MRQPAVRQPAMLGIGPRAEVPVDSSPLLPLLVPGTRRVAPIQARPARLLEPVAPARVGRRPADVPEG